MAYGVAFTDPGQFVSMVCNVCDELMDVKRGVTGPTGFAESMARRKHLHDAFTCPFRDEMWHKQVYKIKEEAAKCPSKIIADIMEEEALKVLGTRQATKEVSLF